MKRIHRITDPWASQWRVIDAFFLFRGRLYLAFYMSLFVHTAFLVYVFNAGFDWTGKILLCGPPWVYESQSEEEDSSVELTVNTKMGNEPGEGKGESEEEGSGQGEGFGENPGFDKEKYGSGQWKELVDRLQESSDLRKKFKNTYDGIIKDGNVSDSYIFRKRDYEDITVKEVFPTVHKIDKPFRQEIREAPAELLVHQERNRIIDLYRNLTEEDDVLRVELDGDSEKRSKSPLQMSKGERMRYLDRNLPQRKEEQMKDFMGRFMNYDPDKGDLPLFVRELYYENLQRLAYTFSGDPTYFTVDYFQENLNKEDFLKNSLALYSEFKDHKVGAEILFTLENIYEIQARALGLYFQNLATFPSLSPESRKELRVEVIRRVLERYKPILKKKNIQSIQEVNELYTKKRLDIMDTLIANTPDGYRRADALFETGRIHWEYAQGLETDKRIPEQQKAVQIWKSIQDRDMINGDFLSRDAWKEIREALDLANTNAQGMLDFNTQNRVTAALRNRLNAVLTEKKLREDRLLWKKNPNPRSPGSPTEPSGPKK